MQLTNMVRRLTRILVRHKWLVVLGCVVLGTPVAIGVSYASGVFSRGPRVIPPLSPALIEAIGNANEIVKPLPRGTVVTVTEAAAISALHSRIRVPLKDIHAASLVELKDLRRPHGILVWAVSDAPKGGALGPGGTPQAIRAGFVPTFRYNVDFVNAMTGALLGGVGVS